MLCVLSGPFRILDRQKASQLTIVDGMSTIEDPKSCPSYQMLEAERDIFAPPEFLAFGTT